MWLLIAFSFLFCCNGWCAGCGNMKLVFESRNFFTVVRWNETEVKGPTLFYSVQYNIYGKKYTAVESCQNISSSICDLTHVMKEVYKTGPVRYSTRVLRDGQCLGQSLFTPLEQSILEAPQVSWKFNETYLTVQIVPPMGPRNRSIEDFLCEMKPCIEYRVNLTKPASAAGKEFKDLSGSVVIWLSETDAEYCGNAYYLDRRPFSRRQSEKASFCVHVSERHYWFHLYLWPGLLVLVILIVLPIIFCHLSVKKSKAPLPRMLLPTWPTIQLLSIQPVAIPILHVESGLHEIPETPAGFPPENLALARPASGYAAQDVSDQSSGHYGLCVGAQTSDSPPPTDDGEMNSIELNPLTVQVLTASDGPLRLSDLLNRSSMAEEYAPLLPNLQTKNEELSADYQPLHVVKASTGPSTPLAQVTSSYRRNWVPGMSIEDQMSCNLKDSINSMEEEDAEDSDEERASGIFLDNFSLETLGLSVI